MIDNGDNIINPVFEKMFKDFVNKVKKSGILQEIKERRYYIKPSIRKRLQKNKRRNK